MKYRFGVRGYIVIVFFMMINTIQMLRTDKFELVLILAVVHCLSIFVIIEYAFISIELCENKLILKSIGKKKIIYYSEVDSFKHIESSLLTKETVIVKSGDKKIGITGLLNRNDQCVFELYQILKKYENIEFDDYVKELHKKYTE